MIKNGQWEQKGWEPTLQGAVRQKHPRGMIPVFVFLGCNNYSFFYLILCSSSTKSFTTLRSML